MFEVRARATRADESVAEEILGEGLGGTRRSPGVGLRRAEGGGGNGERWGCLGSRRVRFKPGGVGHFREGHVTCDIFCRLCGRALGNRSTSRTAWLDPGPLKRYGFRCESWRVLAL